MLKTLITDFKSLSQEEQAVFFSSYYQRRNIDLLTPLKAKKAKGKKVKETKKDKFITVSVDQLLQLKKLGLVK